jgi:site-specific DNA recombinase
VTLRAAIYARQSIANEEGIGRQVARATQIVEARGWDLMLPPYEDNDTSASKARGGDTAWARMLEDARRGRFDVVVAVDMDRLLRSITDLSALVETGVAVLTVNGEIDLTTADGKFRATMLAAIAEFETRRKGERHLRANAARVAEGKPVPGKRRYGYEPNNIDPREPEAQDVRDLYEAFNAGASIRSLSIARGWRTVRVRETLQNPSYKGWVVHKGQSAPGVIVPLVSADVWEEAQVRLADPTRKTTTGPTPKHLASGIATCGVCGRHMVYMRTYRCQSSAKHPSILESLLDGRIEEEVFFWAMEDHADIHEAAHLTDLIREVTELVRERDAAQELFLLPGADRQAMAKRIGELGERIGDLEADIDRERADAILTDVLTHVRRGWWESRHEDYLVTDAEAEAALAEWHTYWQGLTLEVRRAVLKALFTVKVRPGRDAQERVEFSPR